MTIKEYDALTVLIKHSQRDISYGEGGSFCDDDGEFDAWEANQASQAIRYISRLLSKKNHQLSAKRINKAFASGKISIKI